MDAAFAAAPDVSAIGDPFSSVFVRASGTARRSIASAMRRRASARSAGVRAAHAGNAARAARTAASTSVGVASGTEPHCSPVAGSTTGTAGPVEVTSTPPIRSVATWAYGTDAATAECSSRIRAIGSGSDPVRARASAVVLTRADPSSAAPRSA